MVSSFKDWIRYKWLPKPLENLTLEGFRNLQGLVPAATTIRYNYLELGNANARIDGIV